MEERSRPASGSIWLIARHTVRRNIYDLRLIVLLAVVLIGFVLSGAMGARNLARQRSQNAALRALALESSNLDAAVVVRRWSPLGFVYAPPDTLPQSLVITPEMVDYPLDSAAWREIASSSVALDWSFVVTYILSLVCLILTFDSISGEAERGTLRLLIATGASRRDYYLGTLLGACLTVTPLVVVGCLASAVPVIASGIELDGGDWLRLACVLGAILLEVAFFSALGLVASSLSPHSEVSLLVALSVWVAFALIVPLGGVLVAEKTSTIASNTEMEENLRAARSRFFLQSYPLSSMEIDRIQGRSDLSAEEKRKRLANLQAEINRQNEQALQAYKKRVVDLRQAYLNTLVAQVRRADDLSRLSPLSAFQQVAAELTGGGLDGQLDFTRQAETYRLELSGWIQGMRLQLRSKAKVGKAVIVSSGASLTAIQAISFEGVAFDPRGYPRFSPRAPDLAAELERSVPALACVATACLVAVASGFWLCLRYKWL